MEITPVLLRQHIEQSAATDAIWAEYESIALDLTDAQLAQAITANPTVRANLAEAIEFLDLGGMDYAVQSMVLRAADMHNVAYDSFALV